MSLQQGTEASFKEQWTVKDIPSLQMRTVTYNDGAAPWNRINYLMEPDCCPPVMTSITPFLEQLWEPLD
jgi:hypothetical protein